MTVEAATTTEHRLARFFAPRSVALVGASANSNWTDTVLAGLDQLEYPGEVYLVNRSGNPVSGRPAHPSVQAIGTSVDLAYLFVPPAGVLAAIEDARAAGATGLVVLASGYTEAGAIGAKAQRDLVAATAGLDLLGPNGLGFVNYHRRVALFPPLVRHRAVSAGPIALVSQSGGVAAELLDPFAGSGLGMSLLACTGNEAGLDLADVVDYLVDDPATTIVCLFIETIRRPREFLAAARRASVAGKPVVAVKVGRSRAAAQAVAAHTGAIVGDDRSLGAALRAAGVIRVGSVDDLVATAALLLRAGRPTRSTVAATAISGGACSLIADAADRVGLPLARLGVATTAALQAALPDYASVQNPLDVTGAVIANPGLLAAALTAIRQDSNVGLVLCQLPVPGHESPGVAALLAATGAATRPDPALAPVVVCPGNGVALSPAALDLAARHGLPVVSSSLDCLVSAAAALSRSAADGNEEAVEPTAGGSVRPLLPFPRRPWTETQARELLADHEIPVVPGELCCSAEDAVRAADRLGYPVALKASAAGLVHKSDIGGVHLGLGDADRVRAAFESVAAVLADRGRPAAVLVTPMRADGLELIVGVVRDPDWGQVLAVGLGGVWAEVLDDVAVALLPVGRAQVRSMFDELRARPLFDAYRGGVAVDLDRLTDVVVRVAALAQSLEVDLAAIEINPLKVHGRRVEALDATISWIGEEEEVG